MTIKVCKILVIHFTPETLCPYTEWQPTGNRSRNVGGASGSECETHTYRFLVFLPFGT